VALLAKVQRVPVPFGSTRRFGAWLWWPFSQGMGPNARWWWRSSRGMTCGGDESNQGGVLGARLELTTTYMAEAAQCTMAATSSAVEVQFFHRSMMMRIEQGWSWGS
jgi:hypothetical protein